MAKQWLRAQCLKLKCLDLFPSSSTYQLCVLGQVNLLEPQLLHLYNEDGNNNHDCCRRIKWVHVKCLEQCQAWNNCSMNTRNHYLATEGIKCRLTFPSLLFISLTLNVTRFDQFYHQNPFKDTIWSASLFLFENLAGIFQLVSLLSYFPTPVQFPHCLQNNFSKMHIWSCHFPSWENSSSFQCL